ncbi:MAG: retropepsin-like aspartic protease [Blastocatellia bacterium]
MEIKGEWQFCEDGIIRPVMRGRFQSAGGGWIGAELLIDTGADRTVLSADVLQKLGADLLEAEEGISGLGGVTDAVVIQTKLQLFRETGAPITFHGHFTAVTDPTALDLSVLGRDILDLFALIVDRPGNIVCLLSQRHRYEIIQE